MKVIITGTTGYVGEGVLLTCLDHPEIKKVLSVSRRPCGHVHPKLEEYIVKFFGFWNTMSEVGRAMIAVVKDGYPRHEIEVSDISKLAGR